VDNLTHSLFALTLSRTRLGSAGRGTTAALLLASNAPDIDIVALAAGPANYLKWHRGPTHGPLGVIGLGLASAGLAWALQRSLDRKKTEAPAGPVATFGMLAAVSMIAVVLHVLLDLPTSYGSRPLSPFDSHWYALDWMPIVDIYLLLVLVAANLGFGRATVSQMRWKAAIVLAIMAANYGLRGAAHHQALMLVPRVFGPTLAAPCDPPEENAFPLDIWPARSQPSPPPPGKRCVIEIAAIPTFGSPFQWRIVAHLSNAYEIRDVDLLDPRFRADAEVDDSDAPWRLTLRYPNVWTPTVIQAAQTPLGQIFLGFSRFPAARSAVDAHGVTTVRWTDMRFTGSTIGGDQPINRTNLFTATVRIDAGGQILEERLGR
jgi:membrane-bound metal-dependent hydrolase YbcI (DUF457 family)